MGSERQVEANRGNALRSTGPKTPAGKRVVARNAVRHGLLSRELVLPDESPSMLNELRARLRADLRPEGTSRTFSSTGSSRASGGCAVSGASR